MSNHPPIAVQLYSVRDDAARDLPAVLKAVAAMGYTGVEFAGYHGFSASELKQLLADNGLKSAGSHVGIDSLLGDELEKSIAFHLELGNRYLIVPGLPSQYRSSIAEWRNTANLLSEISAKLAPHGLLTGYHNHDIEFKQMDEEGTLPWDALFGTTDKSVVMQFDTGNALHGGKDALPFLQKYPGRAVTAHIKEHSDSNPNALLGEGDVPFPAILAELEKQNATEWLIVEQESYPVSPLETVELCLRNLEKIIG